MPSPREKHTGSGIFHRNRLAEYLAEPDFPTGSDHFAQAFPSACSESEHINRCPVSGSGTHADHKFHLPVIGKVVRPDCVLIGFQLIATVEPYLRISLSGRSRHVRLAVNEQDRPFPRCVFYSRDSAVPIVESENFERFSIRGESQCLACRTALGCSKNKSALQSRDEGRLCHSIESQCFKYHDCHAGSKCLQCSHQDAKLEKNRIPSEDGPSDFSEKSLFKVLCGGLLDSVVELLACSIERDLLHEPVVARTFEIGYERTFLAERIQLFYCQ